MPKQNESPIFLRTILKNSSAILAVKIFMPLSYFIITVSVGRFLGVRDFSILAILFSYFTVFRILSVFGIDSFLIKEIANNEEGVGRILDNALFVGIILSLVNILLMNLVLFLAGYSVSIKLNGILVSFLLLAEPMNRYLESAFIAISKSKYILLSSLISETLKISLVILTIVLYKSLTAVIVIILVCQFLAALLKLVFFRRVCPNHKPCLELKVIKDLFKSSFVLALISMVSTIFLATDVIVLSKIKGELAVGFYSAAYKFITLAFLFADSVGITLLPILSKTFQDSKYLFSKLVSQVIKYFIVLSLIFSIFLFICAKDIIQIIFGTKFLPSVDILHVLIWAAVFLCGSYIYARMLFAVGKQKYDLLALGIGVVINLILNIYFTYCWGYIGTAYATTISAGILFLMHCFLFYKFIYSKEISWGWARLLLAGAVFFLSSMVFARINIYLGFSLSLIIYFFLLVILKVIKKAELASFARVAFNRG